MLRVEQVALKEYGDALLWANLYGMSTDPVRQAQWVESEVSRHSIADYLAKVHSSRWVLDECCRRVPDDPDMVELLLEYGSTLCSELRDACCDSNATCGGTPTTTEPIAEDEVVGEEAVGAAGTDLAGRHSPMLFDELENYQLRLRRYTARLHTSLQLTKAAEADGGMGCFDPDAYIAFRDAGVYELAVEMAEIERFGALAVLFEGHAKELGVRRLQVLGSVPETTRPKAYAALLLEVVNGLLISTEADVQQAMADDEAGAMAGHADIDGAGNLELTEAGREEAEREEFEEAAGPLGTGADLAQVPLMSALDRNALVAWLLARAEEIDERSGQLDNALELLELGATAGLSDELTPFTNRVRQLGMLAYDLGCNMQLATFKALAPAERLKLLLDKCPADNRVEVSRWSSYPVTSAAAGHVLPQPATMGAGSIDTGSIDAVSTIAGSTEADSLSSGTLSGGGEAAETTHQRFEHFARVRLLPFLQLEPDGTALLREHALYLASSAEDPSALPRCAALVHASRHVLPPEQRLLRPLPLLIDTVLRCVYACPRCDEDALDLMTMMYNALPQRDVAEAEVEVEADETRLSLSAEAALQRTPGGETGAHKLTHTADFEGTVTAPAPAQTLAQAPMTGRTTVERSLPVLLDELDHLERHLRAQQHLREYGLLQPMCEYRQAADGRELSPERGRQVLRALARQVARRVPPASSSQWTQTRDDMHSIWTEACSHLPAELPDSEWMQALLLAGHFRLAADFLRSSNAQYLLDSGAAESLVLAAAREYFDSASSVADPSLERVSECLLVLPHASAEVVIEQRLLEGVRTLASFGCELLPLQVRLHSDRLQIVLDQIGNDTAMSDGPARDLQIEPFERLAECLGVGGAEARNHISSAIARLALTYGEVNRALELTTKLVSCGYAPAWEHCVGLCEDGAVSMSNAERGAMLAHAVAHGPQDRFTSSLSSWRLWRRDGETVGPVVAREPHASELEDAAIETDCLDMSFSTMRSVGILREFAASGEGDLAIAMVADQPTTSFLVRAANGLNDLLLAAASMSDAAEVKRLATMGVYAFSLVAATSRPNAASVMDLALGAQVHSQLLLRVGVDVVCGDDADKKQARSADMVCHVASKCAADFSSVLSRLVTARRLQSTLPALDVAMYAANEAMRTASVRKLASSSAPGAFDAALELALDVGLDKWELHMSCVEEALARPLPNLSPASPRAALSDRRINDTIANDLAEHEEALLAEPLRLSRALSGRVFNAVPFRMHALLAVIALMLKAESRLRYHYGRQLRTQAAPHAQQHVIGDTTHAASPETSKPSVVPQELLDRNTELLLELRVALRAFHRVAPECDPRSILRVGCQLTDDHVRLTVSVPPGAAGAWRASISAVHGARLALVAPQLTMCVQLGSAIEGATDGSGSDSQEASLFTASGVWAEQLSALLLGELEGSITVETDVSASVLDKHVSILLKLSSRDIVHVLLLVVPRLSSGTGTGTGTGAGTGAYVPLRVLQTLLNAASRELCTRMLCQLSSHSLRQLEQQSMATQDAVGTCDALQSWRLVASRLAHVETLAWLQSRAGWSADGVAMASVDAAEEQRFVHAWAAAAGRAAKELIIITEYLYEASCSASRQAETLQELLPRWQRELARRAVLGDAAADGLTEASAAASSMAALTEQCADVLLTRLVEGSGGGAETIFDAIQQLLDVTHAAKQRPPAKLIAFARDEKQGEANRLRVLKLLHDSDVMRSAASHPAAHAGFDDDVELMLRLHARSTLRGTWGADQNVAELDSLVERVFPVGDALHTEDGARAAFQRLCELVAKPDNVGSDDHGLETTKRRLLAVAALLAAWRTPVARHTAASASPVDSTPLLHTECAKLLHLGLDLCGAFLLVPLRRAMPPAPILTIPEERALAQAVRGQAAMRAPNSDSSGAVESANEAAERACMACALLSGWHELEDAAICALAQTTQPDPPPDLPLLDIIINGGWLPRLAVTKYWPQVLRVLSDEASDTLPRAAVDVLSAAALCGHAGTLVLRRWHTHPALHSPSAKLAALKIIGGSR